MQSRIVVQASLSTSCQAHTLRVSVGGERREFGAKVKVWATFNEANVMGFCGWLWGQFPPGKFARFKTAGRHLLTCLRAHGAAYIAIKRLPGSSWVYSQG